jgi:hypothetical protein
MMLGFLVLWLKIGTNTGLFIGFSGMASWRIWRPSYSICYPASNREDHREIAKGVNQPGDEHEFRSVMGVGSITGVVADQVDNGSGKT